MDFNETSSNRESLTLLTGMLEHLTMTMSRGFDLLKRTVDSTNSAMIALRNMLETTKADPRLPNGPKSAPRSKTSTPVDFIGLRSRKTTSSSTSIFEERMARNRFRPISRRPASSLLPMPRCPRADRDCTSIIFTMETYPDSKTFMTSTSRSRSSEVIHPYGVCSHCATIMRSPIFRVAFR